MAAPPPSLPRLDHRPEQCHGLLRAECDALLRYFHRQGRITARIVWPNPADATLEDADGA